MVLISPLLPQDQIPKAKFEIRTKLQAPMIKFNVSGTSVSTLSYQSFELNGVGPSCKSYITNTIDYGCYFHQQICCRN